MIKFKYTNDNDLIESLDIEGLVNVLDIKQKICNGKDIDPSNIKLIFLGKILKDNELIKDCGLDEDVTLHVMIKKNYANTNNTNTNNINTNTNNTNTNSSNTNNTNAIPNLINHFQQGIQNTIQNEEFQNNITNIMNHFQQGIQNAVQNEEFQNNITNIMEQYTNTLQSDNFQNNMTNIINATGEIQQNLQNTAQNEEFQNSINSIFSQFQNNMGNNQGNQNSNDDQYTEEEENKINILLNLNIINNREYIINLLKDNNWDQDLVGGILTAYID